jgi:putative ABC transport system permease protein
MDETIKIGIFLALKNSFSKLRVFFLVVSIIAISLANSLFLSGVFGGMTKAMGDQLIENTYSNIIIEPYEGNQFIENADSVMKKIESVPGVQGVTRRILFGATIESKNKILSPLIFYGVDPIRELEVSNVDQFIPDGEYFEPQDSNEIILGSMFANDLYQFFIPKEDTLQVASGDKVNIVFSNGVKREYHVKGIVASKAIMTEHMSFIPIKDVEDVYGYEDVASQIFVKVPTGEESEYIEKLRFLGINGEIYNWERKASFSKFISEAFDVVNAIVIFFSLVVVSVAIFIIQYIQITQRKKQIGILKAIGIEKNSLLIAYAIQALIYGVIGIIFGLVLFLAILTYFEQNPLETTLGFLVPHLGIEVILINCVFIVIVSLIGGIVPAQLALKENIIKAIWG